MAAWQGACNAPVGRLCCLAEEIVAACIKSPELPPPAWERHAGGQGSWPMGQVASSGGDPSKNVTAHFFCSFGAGRITVFGSQSEEGLAEHC